MKEIFERIDEHLRVRDEAREDAIDISREIVRTSKSVISLIMKGKLEEAEALSASLAELAKKLRDRLLPYPELFHSGLAYGAFAEHVEAQLLLDITKRRDLRSYEELGVPPEAYLQGLGDLVGELRRLALEKIRAGEEEEVWRLIGAMESIYSFLSQLDYPDALVPGLRHKVDVARRLLDDTMALALFALRTRR